MANASAALAVAASCVALGVNPVASAAISLRPYSIAAGTLGNLTAIGAATVILTASASALQVNPFAALMASLTITGIGMGFGGVIVPPTISHRLKIATRGNLSIQARAPLTLPARK